VKKKNVLHNQKYVHIHHAPPFLLRKRPIAKGGFQTGADPEAKPEAKPERRPPSHASPSIMPQKKKEGKTEKKKLPQCKCNSKDPHARNQKRQNNP
jgi:hypothetical protein